MDNQQLCEDYIFENPIYIEEFEFYNTLTDEEQEQIRRYVEEGFIPFIKDKEDKLILEEFTSKRIEVVFARDILDSSLSMEKIRDVYWERESWIKTGARAKDKKDVAMCVEEYGQLVEIDEKGNYMLNNENLESLANKCGINFSFESELEKEEKLQEFQEAIFEFWSDRQKIITSNKLEKASHLVYKMNIRDFIFCEKYIQSGCVKDVAKDLGINRNTAYQILKKDEVIKYIRSRKLDIMQETDNIIFGTYSKSMKAIQKVIDCDFPNNIENRLKAIDIFLKHYEKRLFDDQFTTLETKENK